MSYCWSHLAPSQWCIIARQFLHRKLNFEKLSHMVDHGVFPVKKSFLGNSTFWTSPLEPPRERSWETNRWRVQDGGLSEVKEAASQYMLRVGGAVGGRMEAHYLFGYWWWEIYDQSMFFLFGLPTNSHGVARQNGNAGSDQRAQNNPQTQTHRHRRKRRPFCPFVRVLLTFPFAVWRPSVSSYFSPQSHQFSHWDCPWVGYPARPKSCTYTYSCCDVLSNTVVKSDKLINWAIIESVCSV